MKLPRIFGQVRELNGHRGEKKIFDQKDEKKAHRNKAENRKNRLEDKEDIIRIKHIVREWGRVEQLFQEILVENLPELMKYINPQL